MPFVPGCKETECAETKAIRESKERIGDMVKCTISQETR